MKNNFSENLKKIRKENNLSQEELAEELGVSRQSISKWESASAYPEMDKIIALCEKFDLNIDDLLHKDIKEMKKEESAKKNLNKYIDSFLNFITSTVNMFASMTSKSKVKVLIEQAIIIFVLFIVFVFLGSIGGGLLYSLFSILPDEVYYVIRNIVDFIYTILCLAVSLMILIHIFKTRYLNYYEDVKNDALNKISFDEEKIIIRDPKHSEYKIVSGIGNIIIGIIKVCAIFASLFLFFILAFIVFCFALSFLTYKTGIFFIGLLLLFFALAMFTILCLLLILNFVFSRKNDKKKIIYSFIVSIIFVGIGSGLVFIGSLNFNYYKDDESMLKVGKIEYEMNDNLLFTALYDNTEIEYIESNNSNVLLEYKINKSCEINYFDENKVHLWGECQNPIKLANAFFKNLNHKKITPIDCSIKSIKVYTTKENIEKLKKNEEAY